MSGFPANSEGLLDKLAAGAKGAFEMHGIEPGMRVIHPQHPEWGMGQVQSVVGNRVTVNFEHAGKLLLNLAVVALEQVEA